MKKYMMLLLIVAAGCSSRETGDKKGDSSLLSIDEVAIAAAIDSVKTVIPAVDDRLLEKGVRHAASLWRSEDGTAAEFSDFVKTSYIADPAKRRQVFVKISNFLESLSGNFNEVTLDLRKNLDEATGDIDDVDRMFGTYSPGSHLSDDFYSNKIAFYIALNFPYYSLEEKEALGPSWSREEWAMARLGDMFVSRVPAEISQAAGIATGNAEMYIAEYNICMGKLRTDDGRQIFPDDMVLLSHWNLRDEIKSNYAAGEEGAEKQEMIYKVMERIVRQEIPKTVINNPEYEWAPFSNKVTKGGNPSEAEPEPDTRYEHVLNIFKAHKAADPFNPEMNTAILRKFSAEMEISQEEIEALFDSYLSSPELAEIGKMISERLGRDLRPYDIWYDGFKARNNYPEDKLTQKTSALYPSPAAFREQMPVMLKNLGWTPERSKYIADKIVVDPARGSGHAWGAAMKGASSHLRTRVSEKGMDYKGYNIAVHEFGHNVEQTISLYDVDYYTLSGVPNTAVTEALAFVFQKRDLDLLGIKANDPENEKMEVLDAAWSLVEIMGVGMTEMLTWKWLYENPEATPAQLKEKTIGFATETWNKYFAPITGVKDSPVLAIYSHMIEVPLYLPNYSYGHIVQFQIEKYLKDKKLAPEVDRMFSQGKLTPQQWMMGAVGSKISTEPILASLREVLE
ncbi:MAG: hypothetical protein RBS38_08835 [Bacteroidales bacterium]|jgi:hypothetical protein|nr:hypothetical protein [Bacteroidales bacterium]